QIITTPNPCTGDLGTLTMYVAHQVFHLNVNGAGDVWLTGTQTGSATFTSSTDGPSYSGRSTSWFGASLNKQNAVMTDTLSLTLTDAFGDRVSMHEVDHIRFD